MKAYTWSKDSHGLFDYDYTNVNIAQFNFKSACGKSSKINPSAILRKTKDQNVSAEPITE